ncbi:MAG TPA: ABC transporter substrate-binding protein [Thermoanaerobaculia bacterium]|nr:ABC transporter substrate-binding protein [Thermoanaerobaculia bacterium]
MRANPGITVRVQQTPDDATHRHQLYVQWLNARVGTPDVLQLDVIWTAELAAAGWILPLDRFAPAIDDFFPATMDASRWRGELYALPWFVDVGMLYWRTDILPAPPSRIDTIDQTFVWQGARYEGLVTVFLEFLGAFGGEILTADGTVTVNSPAGVRALSVMREQIRAGIAPREVLTWHEEECRFAFQNGRAVLMRNWPYAAAAMSGPDSAVAGKFSIAPMPAAPGGRPTAALGGAPLAINAWSRHPDQAFRLIAFLTAPEQMLERAAVVGQYPSRMSLYDDPRLGQALVADTATIRRIIEAASPRPVTPLYAELSEQLQVALHRALAGQSDPRRALDDAAARMQRLIDESGLRQRHEGGMRGP